MEADSVTIEMKAPLPCVPIQRISNRNQKAARKMRQDVAANFFRFTTAVQ